MDWRDGKKDALDALTPLVYPELRSLAARHLRRDRTGHTLQPTALLHEAYVRLVQADAPDFESRAHFFAISSRLMRQILVDHARKRLAGKRGGISPRVSIDDVDVMSGEKLEDVLQIHNALEVLAKHDERKAKIIELRFFGGLSIEETANALGVSEPTIKRDLRFALAWLEKEVRTVGSVS